MELNQDLIRQAQLEATGANIHRMNEAMANYKAYVKWINGEAWWAKYPLSESDKEKLTQRAMDWERYLVQLINNNKVTMAKPKAFI